MRGRCEGRAGLPLAEEPNCPAWAAGVGVEGGTLTYIIDSLYSSVRFGLMLQKFWVVIQLVGMVGVQDPTI